MKKYTQPKIKSIVLDPEQAVLEVCKVAGGYFQGTVCLNGGSVMPGCLTSVRGTIAIGRYSKFSVGTAAAMPS
ncbi:MAG: hypothetical protein PHQ52_04120 [Candidatus Omnitrophica bacterium]|nr:hypothetical protein [Candidatus Omnitrophota bacterium]